MTKIGKRKLSNVETRIIRNIPTYRKLPCTYPWPIVDTRDGWTRPVSNKVSVQTKLGWPGTRGRIMDGCGPRVVSRMRGSAACEPDLWPPLWRWRIASRVPRRISATVYLSLATGYRNRVNRNVPALWSTAPINQRSTLFLLRFSASVSVEICG